MKKLDYLLIPLIILLSLWPLISTSQEKSSVVKIEANGKVYNYDITKDIKRNNYLLELNNILNKLDFN